MGLRRHSFGSAPLARGTRPGGLRGARHQRFSPARAGNTPSAPARTRLDPVQPRSRGEHEILPLAFLRPYGSAPLARGTHARRPWRRVRDRFSPARAGNTSVRYVRYRHPPVQPRSRGEHGKSHLRQSIRDGSAPLARGTRRKKTPKRRPCRFSPARAGNTTVRWRPVCGTTVQPRSRGGTPDIAREMDRAGRFSPARAGNTIRGDSRWLMLTVQPRLARGTPRQRGLHFPLGRFSPARAGNTSRPSTSGSTMTVQPRSRGEHDIESNLNEAGTGSAPLARGTHPPRLASV